MIKSVFARPLLLAASVSPLALMPASALAQTTSALAQATTVTTATATTTDTTTTVDEQDGIEDIIVTGAKRDVNLQVAPLSVTAVTATTLAEANITEITGLNGIVPGLVVARSGGGERLIAIRGIGSETPENANTQPGVSYHVDGVYIFNSIAANAAFIDVGQVEVLRGPQGTTFGQGSTGGTINVVSKQPEPGVFTGAGSVGAGNYGYIKGDVAINIPIGDTLAIRGAVQYLKHDGYAYATGVPGFSRYELDDQDETGWKLSALWQPTGNFSIQLATIQYRSDSNGAAQKNILDPEPDPRVLTQDYPAKSIINTELYYGIAKFELPFATIKSITSYQKLRSEQSWDADGLDTDLFYDLTFSPLTFGGDRYDHVPLWQQDTESWTQEVNIASDKTGPFKWIIGGVYLWSKNSQYIVEYRASDMDFLRPPLPLDTAWNDPLVATVTYAELSAITRKAWAAYFEGNYDITSAITLTGGIRYNHDEFSGVSATNGSATSGVWLQPQPTAGLTTNEVTGKAAIDFKITPGNMIYLSYTRGFKPGGINSSASNGGSFTILPTYQPETVNSFEIGSKNRFFDNAVQLNVSAFYYDYTNMQFLEEDPILYGEGISNAPKAEIYGLEVEGSWLITPHWKLDGSVSLLEGTFTKDYFALDPAKASAAQIAAGYPGFLFWVNFFPAVLARDAARENIKGNSVPKLPSVQGTLALTYTAPVGPGELTAKAQVIYRGDYQYRLFNESAFDTTPSYTQVNLFVKYQPDNSKISLSLTVTNLFNEEGINSRFSDPYGSAQTSDTLIAPRQVVGSVAFKF